MQPKPLQEWINERLDTKETSGDSTLVEIGIRQACHLRDSVHPLIENSYENRHQLLPMVVSEHTSKSVRLPVVKFSCSTGLEVVMRGNFYNWQISVSSPQHVPFVFHGLASTDEEVPIYWCEGFKEEWLYGPWVKNPKQFTLTIGYNDISLLPFFFLLGREIPSPALEA